MTVSSPKQTRQRLGVLFSLPLFFCLIFFVFQLASERTDIRLLQIQNLESTVNTLNLLAKDAESGERGFLLTGEFALLSRFQEAKITLPKQRTFLDSYEKESQDLQPKLEKLYTLVQKRLDETDQILQVQNDKGFASAIDKTKALTPDLTMNELRLSSLDLLKELSQREDSYLKKAEQPEQGSFRRVWNRHRADDRGDVLAV